MSAITRMETTERMSKIVVHNNTIYLCGQVADNGEASIGPQTENMLAKDEPDHRRLRTLVDQAFHRQSIDEVVGVEPRHQ